MSQASWMSNASLRNCSSLF